MTEASAGNVHEMDPRDLGLTRPSEGSLPSIRLTNAHLRDVVEEAWKAISKANNPPFLFRRRNHVVQIERHARPARIEVLTSTGMFGILFRAASWYRTSGENNVICKPDKDVARDMLENPRTDLPVLEGVTCSPLFDSNAKLIAIPGYYAREGLVYEENAIAIDDVPTRPTQKDIDNALKVVQLELLGDFPFVSQPDRAQAVAALLLPFLRRLIVGCTPLHSVEAPIPGTGKGLLASAIALIATGRPIQTRSLPRSREETRKMVTAELIRAPQILLLDNAPTMRTIDSPELAAALTAEDWTDRILGQSRMITVPNHSVWILTGNNPQYSMELARRSVRVRLDPRRDRPWLRTGFRHEDLLGWVKENRATLLHSLLVLIQNWVARGCPPGSPRLGSFERWAEVVGGVLDQAGVEGFLGNLEATYDLADAEGQTWREFTEAWFDEFVDQTATPTELRNLCDKRDLLGDVLGDGTPRSQTTRLGNALKAKRDSVVGCLRIELESDAGKHKGRGYRVVPVREGGPGDPEGDVRDQGPPSQSAKGNEPTEGLGTWGTYDGGQDQSPRPPEDEEQGDDNDRGPRKVPPGPPRSTSSQSKTVYVGGPHPRMVPPRSPKVPRLELPSLEDDPEDWGEVP